MPERSPWQEFLHAQQPRPRLLRAVGLTGLLLLLVLGLGQLHFVQDLELRTEDLRYRGRGPTSLAGEILLVEIDDRTLDEFGGQYPLSRQLHGLLLYNLLEAGASAVGFDLLFTTPSADPAQDQLLQLSLARFPRRSVLACHFAGGVVFTGKGGPVLADSVAGPLAGCCIGAPEHGSWPPHAVGSQLIVPHEPFVASGAALGHVSFVPDLEADGSYRQAPLALASQQGMVPSLALSLWLAHHGLSAAGVQLDADGFHALTAPDSTLLPWPAWGLHEILYPGDLDVPGPHRMSFVDASRLLDRLRRGELVGEEADRARERFAGKLVLVGLTARSSFSLDQGVTPVSKASPMVHVHASLLDNLLRGRGVQRPALPWGLLLAALLVGVLAWYGQRLRAWAWIVAGLGFVVGWYILAALLFSGQGLMLDVVEPSLLAALGTAGFASLGFMGQERERAILRRTFGRYVSPGLLEEILDNAGAIELGGSKRTVSVLFLDIRGFTNWSRQVDPERLVDELNAFLEEMVQVVFEHGGSVNKFLGDAVLAVFGAPIAGEEDADNALRAAGQMQARLVVHNRERVAQGLPEIRIGIGVATGEVLAGNVGSSRRLEYTVIGDAVNLAARLQARSQDGEVLVDDATRTAVVDASIVARLEATGDQSLKGFEDGVTVHQLRPGAAPTG